jgi:putative membrane protein
MRHWTQFAIAVVAAASIAGCSGRNGNGAAGTSGRSGLSSAEQSFVKDQIKDSQKEIRLGRLAQQNASSPAVKEFGTMVVRDHTQMENQLRDFAERNGVDLRDISNDNERATGTSGNANNPDNNYGDDSGLAKKTGPDFDKDFIDKMVKDHKDAVDAFTKRSEDKDNLQVAQFASQALPKLEEHLQHAQRLQQELENPNKNSVSNEPAAEKTDTAAHNAKHKVKKH